MMLDIRNRALGAHWCGAEQVLIVRGQGRAGPDGEGKVREVLSAVVDLLGVPVVEFCEHVIEAEGTVGETTGHIALLFKGSIAQLGVVACEREVTEGMQVLGLNGLPIRPKL